MTNWSWCQTGALVNVLLINPRVSQLRCARVIATLAALDPSPNWTLLPQKSLPVRVLHHPAWLHAQRPWRSRWQTGDLRVLSWQPFSNTSVSVWEERVRVLGRMRMYAVCWALKMILFFSYHRSDRWPPFWVEGEADECGVWRRFHLLDCLLRRDHFSTDPNTVWTNFVPIVLFFTIAPCCTVDKVQILMFNSPFETISSRLSVQLIRVYQS